MAWLRNPEIWIGFFMLTALGIGFWGWSTNNPYWPRMVFTTLTRSFYRWESPTGNQVKFGSISRPPFELAISLGLHTVVFGAVKVEKWFKRHQNPGERLC
ncbi:MAG: hypothetical protein ABFS03_11985 [Chloroflexota bacterium]